MLQINVIREKAAEAEAIVRAITSNIQRLDVAKRNLTGTIQTIERWGMLSKSRRANTGHRVDQAGGQGHAHTQLKEVLPSRRYKEMSQALAVCQLFAGDFRLILRAIRRSLS